MKKIIVGITGASGSIYFVRLMEYLRDEKMEIHVIASEQGAKVLEYETGFTLETLAAHLGVAVEGEELKKNRCRAKIVIEDNANMFSAVASGSYGCSQMIIIPCSMSTLAEIASGITKTLLIRSADVMIKEQKNLVIVPREMPLSSIHIENMLKLSKAGVMVMPAMPGFYNQPKTMEDMINHVVGKALDCIGIENNNYKRWGN